MSFILDALRKSEHERQRQAGPGITELRSSASPTRWPLWAITLGLLLLINLVFVVLLVLRKEAAPLVTQAPESANPQLVTSIAASTPVVAPALPPSSSIEAVTAAAPAVQSPSPATPPAVASTLPAETPARQAPAESRSARPATRTDPELRAGAPQSDGSDAQALAELPTLNDVILKSSTAIPELHLDLHRYAPRPADRFVFINSAKYREGAQTPDGTLIERITRDGVVLNHRGVRFFLPLE